jgi:saccharopine dehydrogenase-like NADP-dependent oxidoreductase
MVTRVLIIGGYGNFGSYIARSLAHDADILLLIGGRSKEKARAFAASLDAAHPAESHALDIDDDVGEALKRIAPDIVVHTTGPFQIQDHRVSPSLHKPRAPLPRSSRRTGICRNNRQSGR